MATIAGGLEKIDLAVLEAYRLAFRDPAVRHTFRDYSTVHSGKAAGRKWIVAVRDQNLRTVASAAQSSQDFGVKKP